MSFFEPSHDCEWPALVRAYHAAERRYQIVMGDTFKPYAERVRSPAFREFIDAQCNLAVWVAGLPGRRLEVGGCRYEWTPKGLELSRTVEHEEVESLDPQGTR